MELVALGPVVVTDIRPREAVVFNASLGQAGLWTGHGPPGTIIGSHPGDEYLNLDNGDIYTLS